MNNCRYCGAPIDIRLKSRCEYCGQLNLTSKDGSSNVYTLEDLNKLMFDAASVNSVNDLKKYASLINQKSEGTFSSHYFEKYANFRLNVSNEQSSFLSNYSKKLEPDDEKAINHLIQHGELRDKKIILRFLKKLAPSYVKNYQDHYQFRTRAEDNYAKVPRDVFICYNKNNSTIAHKIVKFLEDESISCWIAERNLREEGFSNYWDDIEDALDKTNLVVLVSSESEMNSPDVLRELEYANDKNKKIVEFKIDSSPHNLSFEHLFYGIQWIDATHNLEKAYLNLKKRVFHDLKLIKKTRKNASSSTDQSKKIKKTQKNPQSYPTVFYYLFLTAILLVIAISLRFVLPGFNLQIPFELSDIEALLT